jgi:succinate dehydrogenase/fumarate reductase flavoprotein subunit
MEMIQFTVMPVVPPLINGMRCLPWAPLFNGDGKEFLPPGIGAYSHEAALTVCGELKKGRGPITMDLRGKKPSEHERHPIAAQRSSRLREFGVTPYQRPVEVGVGVLFMMGGVHINERCETSVPGLYAAGEVAGNVHGARRVSGNAFPEMIVFGARAGKCAAEFAEKRKASPEVRKIEIGEGLQYLEDLARGGKRDMVAREVRQRVKSIMGTHAHMIRNREGIKIALQELRGLEKELSSVGIETVGGLSYNPGVLEAIDAQWLIHTAQIVCQAALLREESRGFHYREDFPQQREDWLKHTVMRRAGTEWVSGTKPVVM